MELKTFVAQDAEGSVIAGASVYLYRRGTARLVDGLESVSGAPLTNPMMTGADGSVTFAAPDGAYDLRVKTAGRDMTRPVQFMAAFPVTSSVASAASGGDVDVEFAFVDADGKHLWGFNSDGEGVSEFAQKPHDTAQGEVDIALGWVDANGKLLGGFDSKGEAHAPTINARVAVLEGAGAVNIIPFYGQSNSTGAPDFSQNWRTPMPWGEYPPGYSGALDGDAVVTITGAGKCWTLAGNHLSLSPLAGAPLGFAAEGAARGMLDTIAAAYPDHEMMTFSGGVGGESIVNLDKPTPAEIAALPATTAERRIAAAGQTLASLTDYSIFDCGTYYYVFMWLLSRSAMLVRDQGKRPVVSALVWQQGETDVAGHVAYPAQFEQLCKDLDKDVRDITGQRDRVVILTETINYSGALELPGQAGYDAWVASGYASLAGYKIESARVNDVHAWDLQHDTNAIRARYATPRRDVYMVAPRYPHTSRIHMDPHAARAHGEQFGKVYRKVVLERQGWEPVRPVSWWIQGTQIYVRFSVPFGPLRFSIPPQGNTHALKATMPYGFEHSAGAITQANIVIAAPDLVRITPSVAPAVGQQLHYCKSVRYGSLCDSDPTAARFTDRAAEPNVLRNYCLPFSITF